MQTEGPREEDEILCEQPTTPSRQHCGQAKPSLAIAHSSLRRGVPPQKQLENSVFLSRFERFAREDEMMMTIFARESLHARASGDEMMITFSIPHTPTCTQCRKMTRNGHTPGLVGAPELRREDKIAKAVLYWKGCRVPISAAFSGWQNIARHVIGAKGKLQGILKVWIHGNTAKIMNTWRAWSTHKLELRRIQIRISLNWSVFQATTIMSEWYLWWRRRIFRRKRLAAVVERYSLGSLSQGLFTWRQSMICGIIDSRNLQRAVVNRERAIFRTIRHCLRSWQGQAVFGAMERRIALKDLEIWRLQAGGAVSVEGDRKGGSDRVHSADIASVGSGGADGQLVGAVWLAESVGELQRLLRKLGAKVGGGGGGGGGGGDDGDGDDGDAMGIEDARGRMLAASACSILDGDRESKILHATMRTLEQQGLEHVYVRMCVMCVHACRHFACTSLSEDLCVCVCVGRERVCKCACVLVRVFFRAFFRVF